MWMTWIASLPEQLQPVEARAALVQVVDVGQDAGLGVVGRDRHLGGLAERAEGLRSAPDLDLRDDARSCRRVRAGRGSARRPGAGRCRAGRSRRPGARRAACRRSGGPSPCSASPRRTPLRRRASSSTTQSKKPMALSTRQAEVADPLAQVVERAARLDVVVELANPGLDRLETGLRGEFGLLGRSSASGPGSCWCSGSSRTARRPAARSCPRRPRSRSRRPRQRGRRRQGEQLTPRQFVCHRMITLDSCRCRRHRSDRRGHPMENPVPPAPESLPPGSSALARRLHPGVGSSSATGLVIDDPGGPPVIHDPLTPDVGVHPARRPDPPAGGSGRARPQRVELVLDPAGGGAVAMEPEGRGYFTCTTPMPGDRPALRLLARRRPAAARPRLALAARRRQRALGRLLPRAVRLGRGGLDGDRARRPGLLRASRRHVHPRGDLRRDRPAARRAARTWASRRSS